MARKRQPLATNPFSFGPLALDDAFTDREDEIAELLADVRNGQDVVLYAPRRYGKSSLVLRVAQDAVRDGMLVGYCDLLAVTSKERFAAALAKTLYADIDSAAGQVVDRALELFRGLRILPTLEVDPQDGTLRFSFRAGRGPADIDETIESLLELLGKLAAERKRRVVMIFDEFQEIVELDSKFPNLMRAVFQRQPEVAHVYLGSKRHVLDRIFNDRNEPFWRSAKKLELGPIPTAKFARFIRKRFDKTDKGIDAGVLTELLDATSGHPYATQRLAYELWERIPTGQIAHVADYEAAVEKVLRSEHSHLEQLWDSASVMQRRLLVALAEDPTSTPYAQDYRLAHDLPTPSTLQIALAALQKKDIVASTDDGLVTIVEPFFAEWIRREQRLPPLAQTLGM
jgi:hypothetical protein